MCININSIVSSYFVLTLVQDRSQSPVSCGQNFWNRSRSLYFGNVNNTNSLGVWSLYYAAVFLSLQIIEFKGLMKDIQYVAQCMGIVTGANFVLCLISVNRIAVLYLALMFCIQEVLASNLDMSWLMFLLFSFIFS